MSIYSFVDRIVTASARAFKMGWPAPYAEVKRIGARQSMDGKGCWRDNVFVERLWKSVKYEDVYDSQVSFGQRRVLLV
ncbi:MAG: hypothetical protein WA159_06050, partial [Variovorax sp.]